METFTFTSDDIRLVERFIEIKNKGYYCDGKQLTEAYNRILGKNVNVTNCGSCLRQRVCELEAALNKFKELSKKSEEEKPNTEEEKPNKKAKGKKQ